MRPAGLSAYGTMGQAGNLREWMESAFDRTNNSSSEGRTGRGGHWFVDASILLSSDRGFAGNGGGGTAVAPTFSHNAYGFRVASYRPPSEFRITSIRYVGGETPSVELTFNSRPDRSYSVDASTAMLPSGQPGGWVELIGSLPSEGTETTYVDALTTVTGPSVYYRVRENPN
jgi:hypothetical protein